MRASQSHHRNLRTLTAAARLASCPHMACVGGSRDLRATILGGGALVFFSSSGIQKAAATSRALYSHKNPTNPTFLL